MGSMKKQSSGGTVAVDWGLSFFGSDANPNEVTWFHLARGNSQ